MQLLLSQCKEGSKFTTHKQTVQSLRSHSKLCKTMRTWICSKRKNESTPRLFFHMQTHVPHWPLEQHVVNVVGHRWGPIRSMSTHIHSHSHVGTSIIWIHKQYIIDVMGYMTYLMSFVEKSQPRQENRILCAQQQSQVVSNAVFH